VKHKKMVAVLGALMLLSHSGLIPVSAEDGWRKAYETVLTEFQETDYFSEYSMWNIFDIDSDGVPELVISPNGSHVAGCVLYAFKDGKAIRLGKDEKMFGEWGVISVCQSEALVCSQYFGMGVLYVSYYHFDGYSLKLVDEFRNNEGALVGDIQKTAEYFHNGESVTRDEYYSETTPYAKMHWVDNIGREYDFSQLDLFKGDIPPAKVPVVLETTEEHKPEWKTLLLFGGIPALIIAVISAIVSLVWRHS